VSPKLRKLTPDEALFRRRAGDEPLRDLARDYGVQHTTLGRYFARPEAAKELKRVKRLIKAEQREAEADRRAEARAERAARRRVKQQPPQASRTTEPPAAAAGEARPAQPGPGRPTRRPNSVAVPRRVEPAPTRQGFPGYLDRIDAERAARVGRAPGQPANSVLDPEEWLDHQATLAERDGDQERFEEIARARAEWDAR
jgi:hypothetical protein